MATVPGVRGVHDLHVWTVTSGLVAMSGHVEVANAGGEEWQRVLVALSTLLRERFGIAHVTLQPEEPNPRGDPYRGCSLDSPAGRAACRVLPPRPVAAGAHVAAGHRQETHPR